MPWNPEFYNRDMNKKTKEVIKILEENKLTNIYPTTTNNVVGERIKVDDLSEPVKDF